MKRNVFFISDRTGITAEMLGRSLLTQFEDIHFNTQLKPFIDTVEKAHKTVALINQTGQQQKQRALVFTTIVDPEIYQILNEADCLLMDFFDTFISPLENELGKRSSHHIGKLHGIENDQGYNKRINAINFALGCDDGINTQHYGNAQLILVGVSRCGKTPTSLYLALQYGIYVANYPVTEDDKESLRIPSALREYKDKLYGLSIEPERLRAIRSERRPNSRYADIKQCRHEIDEIETLFRRENIPFINTTSRSIEEIAAKIMSKRGLRRSD